MILSYEKNGGVVMRSFVLWQQVLALLPSNGPKPFYTWHNVPTILYITINFNNGLHVSRSIFKVCVCVCVCVCGGFTSATSPR